jgi:hypothetical protein
MWVKPAKNTSHMRILRRIVHYRFREPSVLGCCGFDSLVFGSVACAALRGLAQITNLCLECSTLKRGIWMVSSLLAVSALQPALTATALLVGGTGVFQNDAPVTAFTAPGAAWSFSFTVDSQPTPVLQTDAGFDAMFSNFSYALNGADVSVTPQIRFFSPDFGGMLDIDFVAGSDVDMDPVTGLSFTGPSIFTGSSTAPTLEQGLYTADGGAFWVDSSAAQALGGSVVSVSEGSGSDPTVPEPDTAYTALGAAVCFIASGIIRRNAACKS